MSSIYGKNIKVSIFGQSHSHGIGVTIDGIPAGEKIDMNKLIKFMERRAPGRNSYSTPRKEEDIPEFLSGIVGETTCGAPLTAVIYNKNVRPQDYAEIGDIPRPGHSDYTGRVKFHGYEDVSGGGHFSGRLTAPLCVAGGIFSQILERKDIQIAAHILRIGEIQDDGFDPMGKKFSIQSLNKDGFPTISQEAGKRMTEYISNVKAEGDSVGGIIECMILGLEPGIGSPIFDGLENRIAAAVFGVPAVKGIEFGAGFEAAKMKGSENNDAFAIENGSIVTKTNNHGGVLGGISSGMPIIFRVAIKPTPSIAKEQDSVSLSEGTEKKLVVRGRHDPCIVPRAVPCIEAAAAMAIYDAMLD